MARKSDPELQALHNQLDDAWTADVPNITGIRRCRNRIIEYLARCVFELMETDGREGTGQLSLRVVSNNTPDASTSRGICSPLKTGDIRRFEKSARAVFGDIESCTTAWNDRSQKYP